MCPCPLCYFPLPETFCFCVSPIPYVPAQRPPQRPPLVIACLPPSVVPASLPCSVSSDLPVGHTQPQRGPWNSTHALRSERHRELDVQTSPICWCVSFSLAASSCCGFLRSLSGQRLPAFLPGPMFSDLASAALCGLGVCKLKRNISRGDR